MLRSKCSIYRPPSLGFKALTGGNASELRPDSSRCPSGGDGYALWSLKQRLLMRS